MSSWRRYILHETYRCPYATRSKASYRSPARARKAIRALKAAHVKLYVYKCRHCDYWHTTSQPPQND